MDQETKTCPHCGGQILAAATKCKHCRARLDLLSKVASSPAPAPFGQVLPASEVVDIDAAVASLKRGPLAQFKDRVAETWRTPRGRYLVIGVPAGVLVVIGILVTIAWPGSQTDPIASPMHETPRVTTPPERTAEELEQERRAEQRVKLQVVIDGTPADSDCYGAIERYGKVPVDLCKALVGAINNGRTTYEGRRTLQQYLKDRGYFRLRGYIVAQHDTGVYEIYRYGHRLHSILQTNLTEYTTRGNFALWARKTGSREITTVSGFTQTWSVFEEDPFGSVVQKVFDAPAGDRTSNAARTALKALVAIAR